MNTGYEVEDVEFDDIDFNTNEFGEIISSSMSPSNREFNSDSFNSDSLQLVPYDGGSNSPVLGGMGVIAEYKDIDTSLINETQQREAQTFVSKIEQFVIKLNDTELNTDLQEYIHQVGKLQYQNLTDLMSLVTINKQMIDNIIARVNASQIEDYPIIQAYSNLVNQHIKLTRELMTVYKSIPLTIKKMVQEVTREDEFNVSDDVAKSIVTQNYGETQFNNSKELLKSLIEKKENSGNKDSHILE